MTEQLRRAAETVFGKAKAPEIVSGSAPPRIPVTPLQYVRAQRRHFEDHIRTQLAGAASARDLEALSAVLTQLETTRHAVETSVVAYRAGMRDVLIRSGISVMAVVHVIESYLRTPRPRAS